MTVAYSVIVSKLIVDPDLTARAFEALMLNFQELIVNYVMRCDATTRQCRWLTQPYIA